MNAATVKALLIRTQERMLALVDNLSDAQRDIPYHPGINPPVWELGHSAFFYEWFILKERDGRQTFAPQLDDVWDSFQLDHRDRWSPDLFPGYRDTRKYSQYVHTQMLERLDRQPLTPEDLYLYRYAIYHQNMHIESMIWARQTLGYAPPDDSLWQTVPAPGGGPADNNTCGDGAVCEGGDDTLSPASAVGDSGDVIVTAGNYWIGQNPTPETFATTRFAFDNEKPGHAQSLPEFAISKYLVTCGEFLEFVQDCGYERTDLWSRGGKRWLRQPRLQPGIGAALPGALPQHPRYWRQRGQDWEVRFFNRWLPLGPQRPVTHISYWEAEAWCQWAGRRLPTDFEWEAAALGRRHAEDDRLLAGLPPELSADAADLDARYLAQAAVSALPGTDSASACRQMLGTCWEWTSSQFFPYDGFTMDMYPFMSTLQFGDHKTTRGGSCATSSCLIRGTYRQAYHPDRDDVFVGFRTCRIT